MPDAASARSAPSVLPMRQPAAPAPGVRRDGEVAAGLPKLEHLPTTDCRSHAVAVLFGQRRGEVAAHSGTSRVSTPWRGGGARASGCGRSARRAAARSTASAARARPGCQVERRGQRPVPKCRLQRERMSADMRFRRSLLSSAPTAQSRRHRSSCRSSAASRSAHRQTQARTPSLRCARMRGAGSRPRRAAHVRSPRSGGAPNRPADGIDSPKAR